MTTKKRSERLADALVELLRESSDIDGAAIVGVDGLVYSANVPQKALDEEMVGATSAAILGLSKRSVGQLKRGDFKQALIQGDDGNIIVTSLNEETLLSIAISDILVVVLRPDQQDFQGTHVTVDVARRLKVPDIFLVVNKVPPDYDFEDVKRKVEHAYNAPVATLLPLSLDVAHVASSQVFCLQDPQHAFSRGVRELVGCLVQA